MERSNRCKQCVNGNEEVRMHDSAQENEKNNNNCKYGKIIAWQSEHIELKWISV